MSLDTTDCTETNRFDRSKAQQQTFSWNTEGGPAIAVVETVAALTGQKPTEMEPLNSVLNTDALNSMFKPASHNSRLAGSIEVEYEGCFVKISGDGTVTAVPQDTQ